MKTHLAFSLLIFMTIFLFACGGGNKNNNNDSAANSTTEAPAASPAEQQDPETREVITEVPNEGLAYIEAYIGQTPDAVNLWQSEPLNSMLQELLGEDYELYMEVMREAQPLAKDRVIYTIGTPPDDVVPGVGYLLIDTENDKIQVFGIYGDSEMRAQSRGEDLYVPEPVSREIGDVLNI